MKLSINRNIILLFCIAFVSVFSTISQAQDISVVTTLDTNKILIGGQTKLKIVATAKTNYQLQWPSLKDSLGKIEIVQRSAIDTSYSQDKSYATYAQSLTITCFDTGYKAIEPITIKYYVGQDSLLKKDISSDALLLHVMGLQVDTSQAIQAIKPPLDIPFSFLDFVEEYKTEIGLSVLVLLVLGGLIWWFFIRKKQAQEKPQAPVIIKPADEIALEDLAKLELKKLWQEGSYKQYYIELSDIIRTYIENRYDIPAMEQTTDETITSLRLLQPIYKEKLLQILVLADQVKFAKAQPLSFENEASIKYAYEFVKSTTAVTSNPQKP